MRPTKLPIQTRTRDAADPRADVSDIGPLLNTS
jgi:hypothetical protein